MEPKTMDFYDLLSSVGFEVPKQKDQFKKEISFIERKTGLTMPQSFHMLMNCCNGKQPIISTIDYIHPMVNINMKARYFRLLNIEMKESKDKGITNDVINLMEIIQRNVADDQQGDKLVPFAYINQNDILLLDFRYGDSPHITMIHENNFIPMAHSVEDLILKIKNYFRFQQVLLLQYIREMRANKFYEKSIDECSNTYQNIESVASKILSEEGCRVLVSSNKYMQMDLEEALYTITMDGIGFHSEDAVIGYDFEDISWKGSDRKSCNIGDIVSFERKIKNKLPQVIKSHLMSSSSITPDGTNRIAVNLKGRHYMMKYSLLGFSQPGKGAGSEASEVYERLQTMSKELHKSFSGRMSKLVPFASLEEENGYICFDYSEENPSIVVLFTPGEENELSECDDLFDSNLNWAFCPIAIDLNDFINLVHFEKELNELRYQQIFRYTTLASFSHERLEDLESILSYLSA